MLRTLLARAQQKHRTEVPESAAGFARRVCVAGRQLMPAKCPSAAAFAPSLSNGNAITLGEKGPRLDLGCCLFCPECERACPEDAIALPPRASPRGFAPGRFGPRRKGISTGPGAGRKDAPDFGRSLNCGSERRRLQRLRVRRERA